MAKKLDKPLLFVDTNIFLNFYRSRREIGVKLLERIESVSHLLIVTDQTEAEFLKNRQKVIWDALRDFKLPEIQISFPGYLSDSKDAAAIRRSAERVRNGIKRLKERFAGLLNNPSKNDPVFRAVKKAMSKETALNLKYAAKDTKEEVFVSALKRFQRGFPPRKADDSSMGDAINWEWVLRCGGNPSNDVLIVSQDGDYGYGGYLNDWLAQEFKTITKRKAELLPTLSEALKRLDVKVTAAEEKEEQSIIKRKQSVPVFWPLVLEQMEVRFPETHALLSRADYVEYANDKLTICFEHENRRLAAILTSDETNHCIQNVFRELRYSPLKEIIFGSFVPKGDEPDPWEEHESDLMVPSPRKLT